MKMKTKALLLVGCAILLVAATVVGTLAYLTDKNTATNTFTVGKVSIDLNETPVNSDGTVKPGERVTENQYHLIPGRTYVKDPMVTVKKGSEASYIRMTVTINQLAALKATFGDDFLPQNYVNNSWNSQVWPCTGTTVNGDSITYEFRYCEIVDTVNATEDLELTPLFTNFTVPGMGVDSDDIAALSDLVIKVEGHAIQAATFADADAAWAAFDAQYEAQE